MPPAAHEVLRKGGLNIKQAWAADLGSSSQAATRVAGRSVRFETKAQGEVSEVEVGPTKPAGAFANVAIWGTSRGGGTHTDPSSFLEAEAPAVEEYLGKILENLL